MLNLSDLPLDTTKIAKSDILLVGEGRISLKYADGIKTDEIEGITYNCIHPALNYEKIPVKVLGETKPSIKYEGTPVKVVFEGVTGRAYQDFKRGGEIKLSLTATAISRVDTKTLKMNKEVA